MYTTLDASRIVGPALRDLDLGHVRLTEEQASAPGMVSPPERWLLFRLLSCRYRGDGAVIDGGSFFGSSLKAEATGLEANPGLSGMDFSALPGGKPIHAYEQGFLPAPKGDKIDRNRVFGGVPYVLGDSFVHILEETAAPHMDLIELHIGDLNAETWDGSPIEIAFIDVCKTIRLNAHVSKQFYPALIGGASTLINQDFFFDRLPWIKVTMGYLKEYFQWEGQVGSSSVYSSLKPVPAEVAAFDPFTELGLDACLELHDAVAFPGISRRSQYFLALSRGYLMALKHEKDRALDYLRTVQDEYADLLGDSDDPRGNQFRMDRAVRQITYGVILKVS